jgi:ArsR family transcriptional regulator, arsenate/arsenite/antimonite-responsive transcriptional repressor
MAKVELFEKNLQDTALIFKALGHPARLAILQYLAETRTCISGDISNELPLSRTTVNQHLKELKELGLIKGEISGAKVNYCLDTEKINQMKEVINKFLGGIDVSYYLECC